ncbi:MAG: hypothetical protein HC772_03530 [Leptolyngbyaceae cyanobacterium CRU_2_3]|nr:hypothetical protein [Leptolyngbyaceae cyanobacterium CRU_2_3]
MKTRLTLITGQVNGQVVIRQIKAQAIATVALIAAVTSGCANPTLSDLPASPRTTGSNQVALGGAPQRVSQEVKQPTLQPLPVPNLIPATPVSQRLPIVSTGRPDPFADLQMAPVMITRSSQPPAASPAPTVTATALPYPPQVSTLPTLPMVQPPTTGTLPAVGVPSVGMPALPPMSLAQAIEVSGVVQTSSSTSIIVKVPDERTTRYVRVGDRLSNGRVLVKRVEMGIEPVVILEQDGIETSKSVGSSGGVAIGAL